MGDSAYQIESRWHSAPRQIRVICVGAGAAGLLVAYKMQRSFQNYDLIVVEKNPEVGGTWYENRYPGCACDVPTPVFLVNRSQSHNFELTSGPRPAHVYTYPFEPNPNWSRYYATAPEIQKYFIEFAAKYDLNRFIQFSTAVASAKWVEDEGLYQVEMQHGGKIVQDWCHILINATGTLNKWKWPTIPGLLDFQGSLLHSANWDTGVSWEGKTVAVIGTGSSAIQIVPQIQPAAESVISFMRSSTWIALPIGLDALKQAKPSVKAGDEPAGDDGVYTDTDKQYFKDHPDEFLVYRKKLEFQFNMLFDAFLAGSEASEAAERSIREQMGQRLGPGHDDLKQRLIPTWPPGCRRLTPGEGYLEALIKDNMTLVFDEIVRITPEGLLDAAGNLHKADIIICATGFDVSFKPSFKVSGVEDVDMHDEFDLSGGVPRVYLGMTVPRFPNYFTINGVRGSWATGTALNSQEACIDYILQCAKRIQTENIRALEVREEPVQQLYEHIDEWHKGSVWNADCKSWYKNNVPGGKLLVWSGSSLHYMKSLEFVRWEHYKFRYSWRNTWAFLSNGKVKAETDQGLHELTPYIRNTDEPWHIE